jgi:methylated-DNA-[protein]-cysteine S-methyltransferase
VAQAALKRPVRRLSKRNQTSSASQVQAFVFPTELGWMAVSWKDNRLHQLTLGNPSATAALASLDGPVQHASEPPKFVRQLAERLQAYASGQPDDFRDVPLDLSQLTEYQRKVVNQCRRIGPGQTLTYAQLAAKAGFPGAARAVGNTMARNRFPILVPCHRVVGAAGSLGGFSAPAGLPLKQRMLALEAACVRKPRPR